MNIDKKIILESFGCVLRDFRAKKGFSQEKLALEAEIARSYLSELERGIKQPTISTLFVIAKTLGVRPSLIISKMEKDIKTY